MGMWNGPVNEHVTADLFVRTVFGEANAFHLQLTAVLESADLKVQSFVGEKLLLNSKLRIDGLFTASLQTLV